MATNLKIYDFLTKHTCDINKNDTFKFYLCGPTVYNYIHIGNARPIITYDVLIKLLKELNIKYTYVHNITDIDDKIINAAIKNNVSELEISEKYYHHYLDMLKALNVTKPTFMPKVTDNIQEIFDFVQLLIDKGIAYVVKGNVLLEVKKILNYGDLVKLDLDHLHDEHDELTSDKRDPKDFVLWKNTKEGITWNSPWGAGRPGWHTECSLFVYKYFKGESLTMHAGGIDLAFPHHVNEKAQFEGLLNKPMSNIWNYVGHVNVNNEKMSKSLGNFILVKDFIEEHSANVLRNIFFSTGYTKPLDFNHNSVETSKNEINKWKNTLLTGYLNLLETNDFYFDKEFTPEYNLIIEALKDDLNFVKVKDIINALAKKINQKENVAANFKTFMKALDLLGFTYYINHKKEIIEQYKDAVANKDYKTSDHIRNDLLVKFE